MRLKSYILGLMAMLAVGLTVHMPVHAAKNEKNSHSSSCDTHKRCKRAKKCCKNTIELLEKVDQTTVQDLLVDQKILGVANQINYTTQKDLATDQEILAKVEDLIKCSCKCQLIMPEDFADDEGNLTQTYLITSPGSYCLGADVDFAAVEDYVMPAIRILSDNVSVDLSGLRLNYVGTAADVAAIRVGVDDFGPDAPSFKNIIIKNGNITNFNGTGIDIEHFPSFFGISNPFESIILSGLNILDCGTNPMLSYGASGINLDGFGSSSLNDPKTPISHKDVIIENCNVNRCSGGPAVRVFAADNVVIKNTQANESVTTVFSGVAPAAYFVTAKNVQMYNCQGNGTQDLDPSATSSQVGSFFQGCINVYMKDCQFNETYGESDRIVNFNCSNSINFIAENCQFNRSSGGALAFLVAGIHMSDSAFQRTQGNGMKYINCQFNGTKSSPANPNAWDVGFVAITLQNIVFQDCQACNIKAPTPSKVWGFGVLTRAEDPIPYYSNLQNVSFVNCTASDLDGSQFTAGFTVGPDSISRIGQQAVQRNVVFDNCIAERINARNENGAARGIDAVPIYEGRLPDQQHNLFVRNCRVSDVHSNPATPNGIGIAVASVKRPVIQDNSVSDCDYGIWLQGTNQITPNTLFQLASSRDNALATPPVAIDLKGTTTYSTGLARQSGVDPAAPGTRIIGSAGAAFTSAMVAGTVSYGSVAGTGTQSADIVTATSSVFTAGMIGSTIAFPNGYTAYIVTYLSPTSVQVDTTLPVALPPAQPFTVNLNSTPISGFVNATRLTAEKSQNVSPAGPYTITYGYPATAQTFTNTTRSNNVILASPSASNIDLRRDSFTSPTNLNTLGWQAGDTIVYGSGGNNLPALVDGNTYYLIVYVPGYCERGVVKNNVVDNCSVSGFKDDRLVTTSSAWTDNVAMDNGNNYDILWSGTPPIDSATVGGPYPIDGHRYWNLSLTP